jgi:hypothetical protein
VHEKFIEEWDGKCDFTPPIVKGTVGRSRPFTFPRFNKHPVGSYHCRTIDKAVADCWSRDFRGATFRCFTPGDVTVTFADVHGRPMGHLGDWITRGTCSA